MKSLFAEDLNVVNVGLQGFADNIVAAGGTVTQLSWAPPAGADAVLGRALAGLVANPVVEEANTTAYARYLAAQPRLVDLVLAREAITGLAEGQRRRPRAEPSSAGLPIRRPRRCCRQNPAVRR